MRLLATIVLLSSPALAQLDRDFDDALVRIAAERGLERLPDVEAAFRARLAGREERERSFAELFGYDPPGDAVRLAFLYGYLFERGGDSSDARRAAELLARHADYRDDVPAELVHARIEYADGLPAVPSFFQLPDYAETWARIRACAELEPGVRAKVDDALAGSADFVLVFPEWGTHNRAMLRALALGWSARALPEHPRARVWSEMARILAADSRDAWEIEDAQVYHPIWLDASMRYAEMQHDERAFDSVPVRYYLRYFVALLAPDGTVPDFGDGWWHGSLSYYYACLARGAGRLGDAELAWAAERVYANFAPFDRDAPDLGRAVLHARLARTPPMPEPREPDPEHLEVGDLVGKKIVVRTGFGADDFYLLLNYRDEGDWGRTHREFLRRTLAVEHEKAHHGHEDENAVVLLMDAGSVLLHDAGYRDVAPSGPHGAYRADVFHNRVVVRRARLDDEDVTDVLLDDGRYDPVRTERVDLARFDLATYSRTRVDAREQGYVWDRTLVVPTDLRVLVVVDSIEVVEEGDLVVAPLWATQEVVGRGPGHVVGRTRSIGRFELPATRDLVVHFPGRADVPATFPLRRHTQDEHVVCAIESGTFEAGDRLVFVTLLWSVEPGTDAAAVAARGRLVPTSHPEASVAVELDGELTILVKTDLGLGLTEEDVRPRYTAAGAVRCGDLETDADVLLVRRSGDVARWCATNMTQVQVGDTSVFQARPFQVFQTSGRSDVVGRSKWRRWEDETTLTTPRSDEGRR